MGNAKNSEPPAASNHTSLPSQTGPMARRMVRRSRSFLAATRWMAPDPRSKPSKSTYIAIMTATAMNQKVSTTTTPFYAVAPSASISRPGSGSGPWATSRAISRMYKRPMIR
jgi:hypothetical protein